MHLVGVELPAGGTVRGVRFPALGALYAVAALADLALDIAPLSLPLDGQRRVDSDGVHGGGGGEFCKGVAEEKREMEI